MNNRIVISWQSYLIFSIISVFAVPLTLIDQLLPRHFVVFLGIGIGVTLIIGLLLLLLLNSINLRLLNLSKHKQELASISIIGGAGVLRGVLIYLAIPLLGFNQPTDIWTRLVTSTTTTLLWFTSITAIITSRNTFKSDYRTTLRTAIIAISKKSEVIDLELLPARLESDLLEIEVMISAAFGNDLPSNSKESLTFAAAHIKKLIEEKIRPLSHRLWIESAATPPKINLGPSILASVRFLNIPPLATSTFLALATIINVSSTFGWAQGVFTTFLIFVEVLFLLTLFKNKISKATNGNLLANGLLLLLPGLLLSLSFHISNTLVFNKNFGALNLMYIIVFLIVGLLVSTFQMAKRDRSKLLLMIEENLSATGWELSVSEKYLTQNAASYLHNLLQSELLAISRQIEISADHLNLDDSRKDIDSLKGRLSKPIKAGFNNFLFDPIERLDKLQNAWKGIAEISVVIPDTVLNDQGRNLLLVQIIEEAIANAVRHANANLVKVTAEILDSRQVCFHITDNGTSNNQESQGFGSAWLNHYAPNSWSRKKLENGSELIFTL